LISSSFVGRGGWSSFVVCTFFFFLHIIGTNLFIIISVSKMLNKIKPGIIPENKINTKPTKSTFEKTANHVLALDAAKQLGISTVNIGPQDLINGTVWMPYSVLGILTLIFLFSLILCLEYYGKQSEYASILNRSLKNTILTVC
jgi:hypothetical protein